jgi:hypothetical protein
MIRNLFGGSKCRTIDKVDIFGDSSGVALYQLDGNANNTGGNYHGTETGVAVYGGGAYERGVISSNTNSNFITTSAIPNGSIKTVSICINPTALPTNATFHVPYMNTNVTSNTNGLLIRYVSAGLYALEVYFNVGGTRYYTTNNPQTALSLNSWTNLVLCLESNNTVSVYKNGTAVVTATPTTSGAITYNGSIMLGQYNPNGSNNQYTFQGSIDQVRIFNRAITATEVATLYAECAPTSTVDNINPFMDGSLKALYKFDGYATDSTGVYNGTATNVTYGTGKFGQCAVFNGSAYIYNASIANIMFKQDFSISATVTPSLLNGTMQIFFSAQDSNNSNYPYVYLAINTSNNYEVEVRTNSVSALYVTTIPATVTITNHFVLVSHPNGAIAYMDGKIVGTATFTSVRTTNSSCNFSIGRNSQDWIPSYGLNLTGKVDQLRIFNKALTPLEVASLYNETTPLEEPMYKLVDPFRDGSGKALYRLEGNALDESGNYNGIATSVTYGDGQFSRCFVGNGTARYILINSVFGLAIGGVATYSAWVKQNTASTLWIISNYNSTANNGIQFYVGAEQKAAIGNYVTNLNTYLKTSSIVSPLNTWVHVVGIVYANGTTNIYVNGVLDTSATIATAGTYTPSQLGTQTYYIGRYNNGGANLNGSIDQLRVFNRALTAGEVTQLYTGENNVL